MRNGDSKDIQRLFSSAFALSIFTIVYNIAEGTLATLFGWQDETLALFGFGVDSFIEALSGVGIAHMVMRIRRNSNAVHDEFERTALRVTGWSFSILAAGLALSATVNIITSHQPHTTFWGVVIALASILVMLALLNAKLRVGRRLHSQPIIADARCTKICIFMSLILLVSSGIYELTHLPHIDTLATFGLAWFSVREGNECFSKAKANALCMCDN